MIKILYIPLIYLACLALAISCSKKTVSQEVREVKNKKMIENSTMPPCTNALIIEMAYTEEKFTRLVMECNILKIQSLDASIRRIKGQRRVEIVYLNVKCDEISRMLSQYELECKKDLTVTGL